jgi:hypothetical protein
MSPTLTSPAATSGAAQWLRDLISERIRYEEEFGWPVAVEVERRRLTVTVGDVLDSVTMPAALGQQVLVQLRIAMLDGPVLASVGGERWTFLTTPEAPPVPAVPTELDAYGVCFTPRGALVVIPGPGSGEGSPHWIEAPRARNAQPPWPAVIATARRVADRLPATSPQQLSKQDSLVWDECITP